MIASRGADSLRKASMGWLSTLKQAGSRPVDGASLGFFRAWVGLMIMVEVLRYLMHGWIGVYFVDSTMNLGYEGFGWVKPWRPGWLMWAHFVALGIAGLMLFTGGLHRLAAAAAFVLFTYVFLLEVTNYLNHFYLVSLVLGVLILLPANATWSLDAMFMEWKDYRVPAWTVWVLRALLAIVYIYAGIAKLNADWLGGEPMRTWLGRRTDTPLIGALFDKEWMVMLFTYGGLLLDLFVVPLMMWRPTRIPAYLLCVSFHLTNAVLFNIGIFPWFMIGATTIFFSYGWPRKAKPPPPFADARGPGKHVPRWIFWVLALFLLVQLLLPLRHFLYPGDPSWTEEGHRYAWHMKLREKQTRLKAFYVENRASGERVYLHRQEAGALPVSRMGSWLTERQTRKMCARPYILRQFARRIAPEIAAENGWPGDAEIGVHAHISASLNARPWQDYILPKHDLTEVPWGLGHTPWFEKLQPRNGLRSE